MQEKIMRLARDSLEKKFYPSSEIELSIKCSFCKDVTERFGRLKCSECLCPRELCLIVQKLILDFPGIRVCDLNPKLRDIIINLLKEISEFGEIISKNELNLLGFIVNNNPLAKI